MRKKLAKEDLLKQIKNFLLVVGGTLILAFGTSVFILPFDLVTGGVSGIAIIVNKIIPYKFITVDIIVTALTWILFFIGLIILGKDFAMKTLISTIIYPIGVSLFLRLASPDFLGGFFCLTASKHTDVSLILATLLGGVCVGTGCSVTFLGGGSTGGVDIIAFTICKFIKKAKSSVVFFIIDASVVLGGMFIIGDFVLALLGVLSAFASALMVDKVFIGSSRSFIAQIITENHEIIAREIIEMDRGCSVIDITGGYSGDKKKMIMVSFKINQYSDIMNAVHRNDKRAFVTIHQAHEISGEGWTR